MRVHLVAFAFALSLAACGGRSGAGGGELLQLVPEDAGLVVTTSDWAGIRSKAEDNHWAGLFGGTTWRDLSAVLRDATQADEEQGLDLLAALASIEGEVVAYANFPGGPLELGVVVQTADAAEGFEEFWLRFSAFVGRRGSSEVSQHGDARIEVVTHNEEIVLFSNGSIHGMTLSPETGRALAAAKGILDRHAGQGGLSIVDAPRFREACADRAEDPALRVFVDGPALFSLIRGYMGSAELEPLDQLGITSMGWAVADFDLGKGERFDLAVAAQLAEDCALGSMLSHLGPVPRRFAQAAPGDAVQLALGNIDPLPTFQAFREFLREVSPVDDERLQRELEEMQEELGLDLELDLLGPLTGRFASMGIPVSHSSAQQMDVWMGPYPPYASMAFTFAPTVGFELREAQAAGRALGAIERLARKEPSFAQAVLAGVEVNRVGEDSLFVPHWGRYDSLVFFSIMDASIRASLDFLASGSRRSFADRPGVAKALSEFRSASLLTMVRTGLFVDIGLGMLRAYSQDPRNEQDADLQSLNGVRWPHPMRVADRFEGVLVLALTREADRIELALGAR